MIEIEGTSKDHLVQPALAKQSHLDEAGHNNVQLAFEYQFSLTVE